MDAPVVEVSPAGRACVAVGLLTAAAAVALGAYNEQSVAQAHGELFSITQAAQHVGCDPAEKSTAKLLDSGLPQPVFLSCPLTQVTDLAQNKDLAVLAPLLGEAKALEVKVDTKIFQWVEHVNAECVERHSLLEEKYQQLSGEGRRGGRLDRSLATPDVPSGKTGATGMDVPKKQIKTAKKEDDAPVPRSEDEAPDNCVYTYSRQWRRQAVDSSGFGCAAARLQGLTDGQCEKRCIVPGALPGCSGRAVLNEGFVPGGLLSKTVRPTDGDVLLGQYQLTAGFFAASEEEWNSNQAGQATHPALKLTDSVNIEDLKQTLSEEDRPIKGNLQVDHANAVITIQGASGGDTVGDVKSHIHARLLDSGQPLTVLAAARKEGDATRIVPWETGLAVPVHKVAWVDFAHSSLDSMVEERIFVKHNVTGLTSWMLRVSAWSALYVGLLMVLWPLSVAPEIMPGVGRCVAGADAAPLLVISAVVTVFAGLAVTSVCWLFCGLAVRGLWMLGGALVSAVPMVLSCTCLAPKERSRQKASYLEGSMSISSLKHQSLGRQVR